jgi:pilus assembly protein Flp/PilA
MEQGGSAPEPLAHGKEGYSMLYLSQEAGQGLVEYALILILVVIVIIAALSLLGPAVGNLYSPVVQAL